MIAGSALAFTVTQGALPLTPGGTTGGPDDVAVEELEPKFFDIAKCAFSQSASRRAATHTLACRDIVVDKIPQPRGIAPNGAVGHFYHEVYVK